MPLRQQTLRNTIAWSYDLLDAEEQRLFRRLSIFRGGRTFEAIESVCIALDGEHEAELLFDRAASLLDKSLIQQRPREAEEPRFWMLETLREFGLESLTENGEMEQTRQDHATYFVAMAEQFEQEHENLRATMQWSLHQREKGSPLTMAWRLGEALVPFRSMHGHWSEGRMFLEQILTRREGVSTKRQAYTNQAAGSFALWLGEPDRAEMLAQESLKLYKQLEDKGGIADALALVGLLTWDRSNTTATRTLNEEVLALYQRVNDKEGIASTLLELGWLARDQGEYGRGRALLEESLLLFKEFGDKSGIAWTLDQMAHLFFDSQGNQAVIHALLEESLSLFEEVGDRVGMAAHYHLAGRVALNRGDMVAARALLEQSLALHLELDMQGGYTWALSVLARVEAGLQNYSLSACSPCGEHAESETPQGP
jgi:tetratricopeptide (TPR) repeat protein